jgi:hypothetical protein
MMYSSNFQIYAPIIGSFELRAMFFQTYSEMMDPNPFNNETHDEALPFDELDILQNEAKERKQQNRNVITSALIEPGRHAMDAVVQQVGALQADVTSDIGGMLPSQQHDDKHKRLDMFAKTSLALFNSVVVYAIADIRTLIRQYRDRMIGDDHVIQKFMDLPITDLNVMMIILANLPLLQELMKKGLIDFYLSAVMKYRSELALAAERKIEEQKNSAVRESRRHRRSIYEALPRKSNEEEDDAEPQRIPTTLEVFDDEQSSKELVYGIAVNRYGISSFEYVVPCL